MTVEPQTSLTGDPLTDALVPLVTALADAVFAGELAATAEIRARAEDVVCTHGADRSDAGWAMATVAAAMLPGGAHPRLMLAWLAPSLEEGADGDDARPQPPHPAAHTSTEEGGPRGLAARRRGPAARTRGSHPG